MKEIKYAALFGGSGKNRESKEYKETLLIGSLLAEKGYIVKNGGYGGMMEAVSKGITDAGGKAIGITCKQVGSAKGNNFLTETVVTETLYQRLEQLIDETELFIIQKGGIGTLSEVFLTLDIIRKESMVNRPKIFLIGDFWNVIVNSLKQNIIPKYEHDLFTVLSGYEELKEIINKTQELS
ncbi:LOG family protein [Aquimarina sp. 2201CG14-23]|uniref:LOG family protein n=1 Tax=Aquimarina mycalae TaxID=3040073 RepID=UPI002477D2AF|nr:LOG family protein [Aquimarina sp. 2201CG14-23]MDH7444318.1 LOG family protein [Aquimarina sp. 2201CG14-23]